MLTALLLEHKSQTILLLTHAYAVSITARRARSIRAWSCPSHVGLVDAAAQSALHGGDAREADCGGGRQQTGHRPGSADGGGRGSGTPPWPNASVVVRASGDDWALRQPGRPPANHADVAWIIADFIST